MKELMSKSTQICLKKIFKLLKYVFLVILCFLILDFVITVILKEPSKYPYGFFAGDEYTYFGDGRFQVLTEGTKSLFDEKHYFEGKRISECIIYDIEKYLERGIYIYIIGYYTCGWDFKTGNKIYYTIPNLEGLRWFNDITEVPCYTILNYETGDIQLYKTLEEIPKSDRKIFEKDLNFWCKFKRTCFEK